LVATTFALTRKFFIFLAAKESFKQHSKKTFVGIAGTSGILFTSIKFESVPFTLNC
jgi:hypothetical protein